MQNTVRRQDDSTLEEESIVRFDPTVPEPVRATTERTGQRRSNRKPPPSALGVFVREKWPELLITLVLAGLAFAVYSLNREVGSLDIKIEGNQPTLQRLDQRLDALDNRFRDEINRLQDRMDRQPPQQKPER